MSHPRSSPAYMPLPRLLARGLAPVAAAVLTVAVVACGDDRVVTPAPRPGSPVATGDCENLTLKPEFAVVDPKNGGFLETFTHTGDITAPMPPKRWESAGWLSGWSVVRHVRDAEHWYQPEAAMAWHGSMCQKPDDPVQPTHRVDDYRDLVFLCRNHVMTATNASSYGVTYLTPDHMVDFSSTAVVRFDVATLRESGRDWIDLWVTPYADNLVTPLEDSLPDLQGEPRRAVHLRMVDDVHRSAFEASVVRDHQAQRVPALTTDGYETAFTKVGLAPSATRRDTFELHISRTHIKFGMPRYNLWWVDAPIADLGWSRGVVQIGHHSFNPTAGRGPKDGPGKPTSWHWDNIGIQPAVPFTILPASRRFVDDTSADEVMFPRGAPAGASLRFSAIGATDVRFSRDAGNGNKGWESAGRQAQKHDYADRFASYWMPVPEGTTRVRFRASPGTPTWRPNVRGPWMVRDIAIWAAPPAADVPVDSQAANNQNK